MVMQTFAVDIFHDQEVDIPVAFRFVIDVVRANDVGMIQRCDRASLSMKPCQIRRVLHAFDR